MAGHKELSYKFDLDTVQTYAVPGAIISSATTKTGTPNVSMKESHYIAFIITANIATLNGAVSAWVLEATAAGTGTKTGTPLKTAQFSAGSADGGTAKVLEVEASELDVANGYSYVTLKLKVANASDSASVAIVRGPNRYSPAGDYI